MLGKLFRQNCVWILAPIVLVLGVVVVLLIATDSTNRDEFVYPLW